MLSISLRFGCSHLVIEYSYVDFYFYQPRINQYFLYLKAIERGQIPTDFLGDISCKYINGSAVCEVSNHNSELKLQSMSCKCFIPPPLVFINTRTFNIKQSTFEVPWIATNMYHFVGKWIKYIIKIMNDCRYGTIGRNHLHQELEVLLQLIIPLLLEYLLRCHWITC